MRVFSSPSVSMAFVENLELIGKERPVPEIDSFKYEIYANDSVESLHKNCSVDSLQHDFSYQVHLEKKCIDLTARNKILKAENHRLRVFIAFFIIFFGIFFIIFAIVVHLDKMKLRYHELSETVKHSEWGFLIAKEFMAENTLAYDELERILNTYRVKKLDKDLYIKLMDIFQKQKSNYSERLFKRLTDFDINFINKFHNEFPTLRDDDIIMAAMIRHAWKLTDMNAIFHISLEALRKRKARLNCKVSAKLKKNVDLDEYLKNF